MDMDENEKAWVLLFRTFKALERAREIELQQVGLSIIEAGVLQALKTAEEPVTPAKLSRWLYREAQTISGLLNRMEKDGLVRKSRNLDKKNLVRVSLTEKGEEALERLASAMFVPKITSHLTKQERKTLKVCLEKLRTRAFELIRELQPFRYIGTDEYVRPVRRELGGVGKGR